jgi:hypothetical protein
VVTRRDLSFGAQSIQCGHAAIDFQHQHPELAKLWHSHSNYLAYLTVKDEQELIDLIVKATLRGIKYTIFREPDINNQITAVAFEPTSASRKLTSSLPLLGKEVSYA